MNFTELLQIKTKETENIVYKYLPNDAFLQKTVIDAAIYGMTAGGKRLRPLLMHETFLLFGGEGEIIEPFMAAIEMIHNYSLIHDDLPAMDNDEYRRGRKTTHAVFGEAMGILAGDALLNYAFETALKAFEGLPIKDYEKGVKALTILAKKAGIYGMIGGQTADIEAENKEVSLETITFIHENKTAALIEASMMIGAILAGAFDYQVLNIQKIASNIGIAFQIQDDILDVTSTTEELGKPVGSDEKNNKSTYVTLKGLDAAKEDVKALTDEAIKLYDELGYENGFLRELILSLVNRKK
ncbi:MAG: polyprenyl synthetase family protein [Lachnospiraceae bacterium]|nr:polyprenyl synthetase family protein [Lachnospiraceae bacterium]